MLVSRCLKAYQRAEIHGECYLSRGGHLGPQSGSQQDQLYISAGTSGGKLWLGRSGRKAYEYAFGQQRAIRMV